MVSNGITKKDLINLLRSNTIDTCEVSIKKGLIRATHFISIKNNHVYDMGSETTIWDIPDFIVEYHQTWWTIEQKIFFLLVGLAVKSFTQFPDCVF